MTLGSKTNVLFLAGVSHSVSRPKAIFTLAENIKPEREAHRIIIVPPFYHGSLPVNC